MNKSLLILLSLTISSVASAQDFTHFPTGGVFSENVRIVAGNADQYPTQSVGIVDANDLSLYGCVDGTSGDVTVPTVVPLSSLPTVVYAASFSEAGCTGERSGPSSETALLTLRPPASPVLLE